MGVLQVELDSNLGHELKFLCWLCPNGTCHFPRTFRAEECLRGLRRWVSLKMQASESLAHGENFFLTVVNFHRTVHSHNNIAHPAHLANWSLSQDVGELVFGKRL